MSPKIAHLAGLAAVVILAGMVVAEIESDMGGPHIKSTYTALTALIVCVLAAAYIARQVIDAEYRTKPKPAEDVAEAAPTESAELDIEAIVLAVKEQIGEMFHADLQAALDEVYRLGMAAGAERVARTVRLAVVPNQES